MEPSRYAHMYSWSSSTTTEYSVASQFHGARRAPSLGRALLSADDAERATNLAFGRIVVSEIGSPNMLVNLV